MTWVRACLFAVVLATVVSAQTPVLEQLRGRLQQALKQSTSLASERQVVAARLEIMKSQVDSLLAGGDDLDGLFRFYETTQAQAAAGPLPASLQVSWVEVQRLMSQLARDTGRPVPAVVSGGEVPSELAAQPLREALDAALAVEAVLGSAPPGSDPVRFARARQALIGLRAEVQRTLQAVQAGERRPAAYAGVIRERRRWYVLRGALQLPSARVLPLDQALEKLPAY